MLLGSAHGNRFMVIFFLETPGTPGITQELWSGMKGGPSCCSTLIAPVAGWPGPLPVLPPRNPPCGVRPDGAARPQSCPLISHVSEESWREGETPLPTSLVWAGETGPQSRGTPMSQCFPHRTDGVVSPSPGAPTQGPAHLSSHGRQALADQEEPPRSEWHLLEPRRLEVHLVQQGWTVCIIRASRVHTSHLCGM